MKQKVMAGVSMKVKALFGGRVRKLVCGAAPISNDVMNFFKKALGIHVYECYGQTEISGPGTFTHPLDKHSTGYVGGIIPSLKVRLQDCPELGYLSSDNPPRGQVQFKGTALFKGYFKNPEKTKEAFTEDGWVNSGDVAVILPNGAIKIIDRAKNIFKLSQGEYIAPEKLENIYGEIPKIAQIFVYGDSLKHFLVAVVVPDPVSLKAFAEQ
jgi:long-chain acyl-CoA synthetase